MRAYTKSLQFILTFDFLDPTNDKKTCFTKMKLDEAWGYMIKLRWVSFTILNWDCINEFARKIKRKKGGKSEF